MKSIAEFKQAVRSVVRFRRRTLFMMLGVAVGITSLTLLNSIGENTRRETTQRVKNMLGNVDTVTVRPSGGKSRGMVSLATAQPVLKFADADAIAQQVPGVKQVAELQNAFDVDVGYRDREASPAVFGVSSNWLELRGDQLEKGAFLTEEEQRGLARSAVLGPEVARNLFGDEDPLGKTLRVGGVPFQVTGVVRSRGAGPTGSSLDNIVYIPVTTASKRLFNRDYLTMVIVQLKNPDDGEAMTQRLTSLLRDRHHLVGTALDDFSMTNPRAVIAYFTSLTSTLAKVLTGVAALSMLIGAAVIMSLMIIGVSERRKEIGVRRAVGASRGDILLQFLIEALLISVTGGALGAVLGIAGANGVAAFQHLPPILAPGALLLSVGLAAAVGLAFGMYPAWRASRVDPVAALRA